MRYAIFRNEDGTETGMCEAAAFRSHSEDTDVRPMRVVREIEAGSWEEATAAYREMLDSEDGIGVALPSWWDPKRPRCLKCGLTRFETRGSDCYAVLVLGSMPTCHEWPTDQGSLGVRSGR